ncbi:helix-turn-helix domain-containing protein [Corynebacterium comes]|uniref:Helix-turn-helix domain-containing protein n=1 Tax=Corynebacterium comes TaxID=2675218 RepID=A0A6B8W5F1_9CORY|nr:helix-turn-helix domain-containing protein [Corynebacterium comes]QGU05130.1 hypothetical protein CETAM_09395 [Corynebacterium comes]
MSKNNVIDISTAIPRDGEEPWVSVKTAAAHFELSTRTVERLIAAGKVPVLRLGRANRVRLSDVLSAGQFIPAVAM